MACAARTKPQAMHGIWWRLAVQGSWQIAGKKGRVCVRCGAKRGR